MKVTIRVHPKASSRLLDLLAYYHAQAPDARQTLTSVSRAILQVGIAREHEKVFGPVTDPKRSPRRRKS